MFRAISHQLYGTEDKHLQIRLSLHEFIVQNRLKFGEYWIDSTTSYSSHIQNIKDSGSWGTELELKACSDYLSLPVFVCSPDIATKAYRWERFTPQWNNGISSISTLPFTVNHIEIAHSSTRNHYDSIVPYAYGNATNSPSPLLPPTFRTKVVASLTVE